MKVITLFGTRPEIIRLSQVIKRLDLFCEQVLIHTGQNYDCLLYTSPSPRDRQRSRMPSSA